MAQLHYINPLIVTIPADRQRRAFTTDDIDSSIKSKGVLQPIVVCGSVDAPILVAGERRLTSARKNNLLLIPCQLFEELTELQHQEIEYEENVKRLDLTWQDQALATFKLHKIYAEQSGDAEGWTFEGTAQRIGMSNRHISRLVHIGEALAEGDETILKSDNLAAAFTILDRRKRRGADEAVQQLFEMAARPSAPSALVLPANADGEAQPGERVVPTPPADAPFRIIEADAIDFFRTYSGDKFNFLHCDLPYGVELHGQANQDSFGGGGYDSNPDIYWTLLKAIAEGWSRVMFPSSHLMFWFAFTGNSGEGFYQETIAFLEDKIPGMKIHRNPLVWTKTDNRGILADPKRTPRNITEFALLGSTGDRYIVKPVANWYGAPTSKSDSIHTNEKPIPVLNHFFQMLVDEHTRILDPTAGSGSAIRAAEIAKAELGLGLEFNPEFAVRAQRRLETERGLRKLSGGK